MIVYNIADKEQTGGWRSLQIVPLDEILSCPDILTNQNVNQVSLYQGPTTIDVLPVSESMLIAAKRSKSKGSTIFDIKLTLDFYYQSIELDNFLNDYANKKVVLLGTTTHGSEKLFGSKLHPLTFEYDFIDPKTFEEGAATQVIISGKIPQKPVIIKD